MNRPPRRSVISTGTTTIVLIFVLLCLLTFSVLSLVSAEANMRMSKKSADHTTAYYTAENTATDILNHVIRCIQDHIDSSNDEGFYQAIRQELEGTDGITFTDDRTLTWQVPIKEEQSLTVTVALSFEPLSNGNHYQIISWSTANNYAWGEDQTLPLPHGDSFPDISTEE